MPNDHHHTDSRHHVPHEQRASHRVIRPIAPTPTTPGENAPRHTSEGSSSTPSTRGRTASSLGLATAGLGLAIEVLGLFSAGAHGGRRPPAALDVTAIVFGLAAAAFLLVAQRAQTRTWSRRAQKRIRTGTLLVVLLLLIGTAGLVNRPRSAADEPRAAAEVVRTEDTRAAAPPRPAAHGDDSALEKPSWYGEKQQDGLLLVVISYAEDSREALQFSRRLLTSVSYAALTLINAGSTTPIALKTLRVKLRLDAGEVRSSLPVEPLLEQRADENRELLKRLALPQDLAFGGMLADVPICLPPGFSWEHVAAVIVTVDAQEIVVPGRLMSAEEKRGLLAKTIDPHAPTNGKGSAESWFKGL